MIMKQVKNGNSRVLRVNGALVLLLAGLLSSCCTPGVKPEDANVFQAACGLYSGDYEAQKKARQADVEKSRSEVANQQSESQQLESDLSQVKQEETALRERLGQLSVDNQLLETQISGLSEATAAEKRAKAKKLEKLNRIKKELEAVKMRFGQDQDTIEATAKEVDRLEREVSALRSIILSP